MTTSPGRPRVCGRRSRPASVPRRPAPILAFAAAVGLLAFSGATASAANNPGTGDSGFFTFRPSAAVGGTQINVASGNALVRTRDLSDSLLNYHVVVDRAYNSLAPDTFSILSPRWTYDVGPATGLTVHSNQDVTVNGPSGYRIRFARQTDGSYTPPDGFDGSLTKTSAGWTLVRTSQGDEFGFDNSGTLTWTKDAAARDFTVQGTSAAGRTVLSSYGTNSGRRVNLSYTGDSLVREMDDPSSGHHYYRYTAGRLTAYESPSGQITSYRYDGNGLLDKITEPGGTTVELDLAASGRVRSITTTLPGGFPQTTSFVYTRRTYKSDVTAPDNVRRTYAYDDDWRVTRQYNPDVVPTVAASGELKDLEGQYVNGNQTYPVTIAADEPDGAGLTHLGLQRTGAVEIVGADPPCTNTLFDRICPTDFTAPLQASLSSVPEGRQTLRGIADDDEQHHASTDPWDVLVDRSAPAAASNFQLSYFNPADLGSSASVTWNAPADPVLPDGTPGSGVVLTESRYRINGGSFTTWSDSEDGNVAIFGGTTGDQFTVEVRSTDAVGNVSPVGSDSVTLVERLEDPGVQQMAIEYYQSEYGGSAAQASAWLDVQDHTENLGAEVSASLPSGSYAGIWLDNDTRRVKVGLTTGTSPAPAQQVIVDRGLTGHADIVYTDYTQRQLEVAQPPIEDELQDLLDQGLVAIGRNPSLNRIEIDVAGSATTAQRARVQAAADNAPVLVAIINSTRPLLTGTNQACKRPYCDSAMRGGVGIGPGASQHTYRRMCTSAFNALPRDGGFARTMTAGHCIPDYAGGTWGTLGTDGGWAKLGTASGFFVNGVDGDAGSISIDGDSYFRKPGKMLPVIFMDASTTGSTTFNTNYDIRGVAASVKGRIVCMNGSTNGSRCLTVQGLNKTFDPDNGPLTKHLAKAKACGTDFGDSGAPVVKNHLAYGIFKGDERDGNQCYVYYQGAAGAQDLLKMNIMTRR